MANPIRHTGGLGHYAAIMPEVARDRRMVKLTRPNPEAVEVLGRGVEATENTKTLRDLINKEGDERRPDYESQATMGPPADPRYYRKIEQPGGEDPDTNIASAVRSFGRNFVPGADHIAAWGAWLEHPEVPFAQHLVEQRYWNKRAENDMPHAAMAGIGAQAAALPMSKAPGLRGAVTRIGQQAGLNAAMDLTQGRDPHEIVNAARTGAAINAGLEVVSPWIGQLLSRIPEAGRRELESNPIHMGIVASRAATRDVATEANRVGGFTYDPARHAPVSSGYALSTHPELGQIDSGLGGGTLERYINRQEGTFLHDPNAVAGGWRNPETGKWELDVSKVVPDREEALRQASAAHQKAIYDLGAHQTIPVPGSGFGEAAPAAVAIVPSHTPYAPPADRNKPPGLADGGWTPPNPPPPLTLDQLAIDQGGGSPMALIPSHTPGAVPTDDGGDKWYDASGVIRPELRTPSGNAPIGLGALGEAIHEVYTSPTDLAVERMRRERGSPASPSAGQPPSPDTPDFGQPPPPRSGYTDPYQHILGMMQPPAGAVNEIARTQQQQFGQEADVQGAKAAWSQEQMKWYSDARSKIDTDYKATVDDYRNAHIEPGKIFHDKSTPQKAMAMIGLVLGGLGSGLSGQPNMAAAMIQKRIEMDLESQVHEMDKKKNLVSMNYEKYGNLDQAVRMSYMQQAAFYESKIHQIAATSNAAQAAPQAQMALWKLREPLIPVMVQIAQYQGLQNMIRSGGHVVGDMPAPWDWNQYMATAMPGPNGRTTFARSPEDRGKAVEGLQKWGAFDSAVKNLSDARSTVAAVPGTDASAAYNQYHEAAVLSLANAMGTNRGEALKMVERAVPGGFEQWYRGDSLDALKSIGANGKWSIWETHGSLHRPNLPKLKSPPPNFSPSH